LQVEALTDSIKQRADAVQPQFIFCSISFPHILRSLCRDVDLCCCLIGQGSIRPLNHARCVCSFAFVADFVFSLCACFVLISTPHLQMQKVTVKQLLGSMLGSGKSLL
jgi:hypothetical protein